MFLNGKKFLVRHLLIHKNKYVTDFKEKAEIFNSFFAEEYSLIRM